MIHERGHVFSWHESFLQRQAESDSKEIKTGSAEEPMGWVYVEATDFLRTWDSAYWRMGISSSMPASMNALIFSSI